MWIIYLLESVAGNVSNEGFLKENGTVDPRDVLLNCARPNPVVGRENGPSFGLTGGAAAPKLPLAGAAENEKGELREALAGIIIK